MLSRRSLLAGLLGAVLAIPLGTVASTDAEAQPRPERRPQRPRPGRRPPAPRRRVERRPRPRPGFIWVPGRWVWNARRGRWVWVSGHWVRRRGRW
ncbi:MULTISPECIES: YXWGXW repeat-containing protein [Microvirga]|jgi:hypothetical protein|uniref:BcpO-related WXXGXW repeat protein n=1 Tax=Microvirga tunisiensis TaxID=2108360 RepID=A0A5N7ME68_9HYPH|nr:YXWGXW repeat-containing protein [Microvirga tunisiensis]MPR06942.1 hypothetical protein [Microvirga tunisiensis]MPR25173.1 hypothetical protein [Microvirga tunisiensis]